MDAFAAPVWVAHSCSHSCQGVPIFSVWSIQEQVPLSLVSLHMVEVGAIMTGGQADMAGTGGMYLVWPMPI